MRQSSRWDTVKATEGAAVQADWIDRDIGRILKAHDHQRLTCNADRGLDGGARDGSHLLKGLSYPILYGWHLNFSSSFSSFFFIFYNEIGLLTPPPPLPSLVKFLVVLRFLKI